MQSWIRITALILLGLVTVGCAGSAPALPSPEPTPTPLTISVNGEVIELVPGVNVLPEIYEAAKSPEFLENSEWVFVDGYWDVMPKGASIPLEVEESLPEAASQLPFPGFPENWVSYSLPTQNLEFDYPSDWQVETLEKGVRLFPADGSFWINVESYHNPVAASLQVWLAEYGPALPGEVLAEFEETINGQPALRQQVMLPAIEGHRSGEGIYLWMTSGDRIFHWTAWPGDEPETYDLLIFMASTLR